jgi:3-hydroxyacyl-[acyl-carrier-protein] dehydratase
VTSPTSLDIESIAAPFGREVIEQLIPHREPFLFVDEVLELEPGARIVARKHVSADEWYFAGHFPERPVLPGVIMVEALAQACAIAVFSLPAHHGKLPLFGGIDKIRFKRIVSPGEDLTMTCKVELVRGVIGRGTATGHVGDELAVRGSLVFLP